jgi:phenylacetate-CoA ligase
MKSFRHQLTDLYQSGPRWLKTIWGTAMRVIPQDMRYGKEFSRTRTLLESSQWWDEAKLAQYQRLELKRLLKHAYRNVPYYRKLFCQAGFHPDDFRDFSDLKDIPFLTKKIVRKNLDSLVARNVSPSELVKTNTGGSSGEPMVFYRERSTTSPREKAFTFCQWRRAGFVTGDRIAVLRGPHPNGEKIFRFDQFLNLLVLSSFRLNSESVRQYVDALNKYRPKFLHVYPSTGVRLAALMSARNLGLDYQLKAVLCGSEKLFAPHRALMEKVFECRIFSWYGHSEYAVLAGECENSPDYHVFPEYGYTEFLKVDHTAGDDQEEIFEVVGTGFNNYAFPFIRYRTGDYATLKKGYCDRCHRRYPLIKEIMGREQDWVITRDGNLISLTALIFGQHLEAFNRIEKMQLEQRKAGEIIVKVVSSNSFDERDETRMKQAIHECAGQGLKIGFEYPRDIESTHTGKHPFLRQHLNLEDFSSAKETYETGTAKQ